MEVHFFPCKNAKVLSMSSMSWLSVSSRRYYTQEGDYTDLHVSNCGPQSEQ